MLDDIWDKIIEDAYNERTRACDIARAASTDANAKAHYRAFYRHINAKKAREAGLNPMIWKLSYPVDTLDLVSYSE